MKGKERRGGREREGRLKEGKASGWNEEKEIKEGVLGDTTRFVPGMTPPNSGRKGMRAQICALPLPKSSKHHLTAILRYLGKTRKPIANANVSARQPCWPKTDFNIN